MSKKVDIKRGSTVVAVGEGLEFHGEWMQHGYVTVTVKSAVKIDFQVGDYVEYRGERFYLWSDENVKKQARSGSHGEAFVYENLKLMDATVALEQVSMHDFVLGGSWNTESYSSLGRFSFFGGSVDDLADRIQANLLRQVPAIGGTEFAFRVFTPSLSRTLQRLVVGDDSSDGGDSSDADASDTVADDWEAYYDGDEETGKSDVTVGISDETLWGALARCYNDFELPFYVHGTDIVIGGKAVEVGQMFAYGKDNGLKDIERMADQEQRIVTRLFAYGSTENVPLNYYGNVFKTAYVTGTADIYNSSYYFLKTGILFEAVKDALGWSAEAWRQVVMIGNYAKVPITVSISTALDPNNGYSDSGAYICAYEESEHTYLALLTTQAVTSHVTAQTKVYMLEGVDLNKWPSSLTETAAGYAAGMAIQNLMLPGFPTQTLADWVLHRHEHMADDGKKNAWLARKVNYNFSEDAKNPWIQSKAGVAKYGVREGEVYFDGSDDRDEIKPTIENTSYGYAKGVTGISDNGWVTEGGNFKLTVYDDQTKFWGAVFKTRTGDKMPITMTSGYHNGREFEVSKVTYNEGSDFAVLEIARVKDERERFIPNTEEMIALNDTFIATGIQLPDTYITEASEVLFDAALDALDEADHATYTHTPHIDEIFMARERDEAAANETVSLHDTIRPGMVLEWQDVELGNVSSVIDSLTIKDDGNNGIPTYEVVLRNEKEKTLAQTIGAEIKKSVSSGGSGRGEKPTAPSAASIIEAASGAFLSKTKDDTAQGLIGFVKGLWVKTLGLFGFDQYGNATAKSLTVKDDTSNPASTVASIDDNGDATLHDVAASGDLNVTGTTNGTDAIFENLTVKKAAHFFKLIIDEVKATQGQVIITAANAKLDKVVEVTGGWKCYFRSSDADGNEISNTFAANDLVLCQTFNAKKGVSEQVDNRFYWRKCTAVGSESQTVDGQAVDCHYIILSSSVEDSNSNADPQAGDEVVQLGNDTDTTRRAAIIISAYNNTYLDPEIAAPSIVQYDGIDKFSLSWFRKNVISKTLNKFTGDFDVTINGNVSDLSQFLVNLNSVVSTVTKRVGKNILSITGWTKNNGELLTRDESKCGYTAAQNGTAREAFAPIMYLEAGYYCFSWYGEANIVPHYYWSTSKVTKPNDSGTSSQSLGNAVAATGETYNGNQRYYKTFQITTEQAATRKYFFMHLYKGNSDDFNFYRPMLEVVADANGVPSVWDAGVQEYGSIIKQTADSIDLGVRSDLGTVGININGDNKTVNLRAGKVNFVDPSGNAYAIPKISIDPTTGTLHAVDGEFEGTVKASNLYHSICYYVQLDSNGGGAYYSNILYRYDASLIDASQRTQPPYSNFTDGNEYTSYQIYDLSGGELTEASDGFVSSVGNNVLYYYNINLVDQEERYKYSMFQNGGYYTSEQIYNESDGVLNSGDDGFIPTTGKADVVMCMPKTSNWNENDRVTLPMPEDFQGKIVEISAFHYGSGSSNLYIQCVSTLIYGDNINNHKIAPYLYINSSGNITVLQPQPYAVIATGGVARFLSAQLTNGKWVWVLLANQTGGDVYVIGDGGGIGGGTVTEVGMSVPTGFKVSNSDSQTITDNGTFALSFGGTLTKNRVLATPSSVDGAPSWRSLVSGDIPSLAASKITSGTFDAARIPNLSWNKITSDKPTTIAGYGITDAYISNETIYLGGNSITPITDGDLGDYVSVDAGGMYSHPMKTQSKVELHKSIYGNGCIEFYGGTTEALKGSLDVDNNGNLRWTANSATKRVLLAGDANNIPLYDSNGNWSGGITSMNGLVGYFHYVSAGVYELDYLPNGDVGVQNGKVLRLAAFPNYNAIRENANYNQDYAGVASDVWPAEAYFKGLVRWAIDTYPGIAPSDGTQITLMGSARPNSSGTAIIELYSTSGYDSQTKLPRYCSGTFRMLSGQLVLFGTDNYTWYWNIITPSDLATRSWVTNSATAASATNAAKLGGVAAANYATQSWVNSQGHVASAGALKYSGTAKVSAQNDGALVDGYLHIGNVSVAEGGSFTYYPTITFGDYNGMDVYIQEDSEDHMTIRASAGITLLDATTINDSLHFSPTVSGYDCQVGMYLSSTLFNFVSINGQQSISGYKFDAEVQAPSFKKTGSSNDYVLLGGGGTKAVGDFTTWMDSSLRAKGLILMYGDTPTLKSPKVTVECVNQGAGRYSLNFTGSYIDSSDVVTPYAPTHYEFDSEVRATSFNANQIAAKTIAVLNSDDTNGVYIHWDSNGYLNIHGDTAPPRGYVFDAPVTQSSDARLKNIVSHAGFEVDKLATLPLVWFTWKKDERRRMHFGSIAQEWQKVLPEVVSENGDGMLAMDYGAAAMAAGVTACREVVALKKEIEELKEIIRELKNNK